jgi:GT2 family glycosyltransferase
MKPHFSDRELLVNITKKGGATCAQTKKREVLPLDVVIVSYNSRNLLRDCLASLESEPFNQVIVVDNVSSDGSVGMVAQDFPWVRLIQNKKNDGYGAAANLAIASCSENYILLLNCDTLLQPGTLQVLSNYLDQHQQVAIVGPALLNFDETRQASWYPFPAPLQVLRRETSLSKIGRDHLANHPTDSPRAVPWVLGAALTIRRSAFESVGGFDEAFFMYYEEVDLCYRLKRSGWEIHFAPAAAVYHVGGASTRQQQTTMTIQLYKSLCRFYQQHYSGTQKNELRLVLSYLMLRNIILEILAGAQKTSSNGHPHPSNNLQVWRLVLSNMWARNGWLIF